MNAVDAWILPYRGFQKEGFQIVFSAEDSNIKVAANFSQSDQSKEMRRSTATALIPLVLMVSDDAVRVGQ